MRSDHLSKHLKTHDVRENGEASVGPEGLIEEDAEVDLLSTSDDEDSDIDVQE